MLKPSTVVDGCTIGVDGNAVGVVVESAVVCNVVVAVSWVVVLPAELVGLVAGKGITVLQP